MESPHPRADSALVIVDVQNDFLPGGRLAVKNGGSVIPVLNRYIDVFVNTGRPVFATRDWHPAGHCSFAEQGGMWPAHCVAGTDGAAFPSTLRLPADATIVSKASRRDADAYSGFEGTELEARLNQAGVSRLYIGGLATDYCVLNTVCDAVRRGYEVYLLLDAIAAVNVNARDGDSAIAEMLAFSAKAIRLDDMARSAPARRRAQACGSPAQPVRVAQRR